MEDMLRLTKIHVIPWLSKASPATVSWSVSSWDTERSIRHRKNTGDTPIQHGVLGVEGWIVVFTCIWNIHVKTRTLTNKRPSQVTTLHPVTHMSLPRTCSHSRAERWRTRSCYRHLARVQWCPGFLCHRNRLRSGPADPADGTLTRRRWSRPGHPVSLRAGRVSSWQILGGHLHQYCFGKSQSCTDELASARCAWLSSCSS